MQAQSLERCGNAPGTQSCSMYGYPAFENAQSVSSPAAGNAAGTLLERLRRTLRDLLSTVGQLRFVPSTRLRCLFGIASSSRCYIPGAYSMCWRGRGCRVVAPGLVRDDLVTCEIRTSAQGR